MVYLTSRHVLIMLIVGILLSLAVFFRYDVTPAGNGYNYYKLDQRF
jgi:hypothetical protein